ncbi:hypothetical protein FKM82_021037 [Ascaphus truei]
MSISPSQPPCTLTITNPLHLNSQTPQSPPSPHPAAAHKADTLRAARQNGDTHPRATHQTTLTALSTSHLLLHNNIPRNQSLSPSEQRGARGSIELRQSSMAPARREKRRESEPSGGHRVARSQPRHRESDGARATARRRTSRRLPPAIGRCQPAVTRPADPPALRHLPAGSVAALRSRSRARTRTDTLTHNHTHSRTRRTQAHTRCATTRAHTPPLTHTLTHTLYTRAKHTARTTPERHTRAHHASKHTLHCTHFYHTVKPSTRTHSHISLTRYAIHCPNHCTTQAYARTLALTLSKDPQSQSSRKRTTHSLTHYSTRPHTQMLTHHSHTPHLSHTISHGSQHSLTTHTHALNTLSHSHTPLTNTNTHSHAHTTHSTRAHKLTHTLAQTRDTRHALHSPLRTRAHTALTQSHNHFLCTHSQHVDTTLYASYNSHLQHHSLPLS